VQSVQVAEKKLQLSEIPASFTGFSTKLLIKKDYGAVRADKGQGDCSLLGAREPGSRRAAGKIGNTNPPPMNGKREG
jgi:hypothetical protein